MADPHRTIGADDVRRYVEERCFPVGRRLVGAELEWFVTGDARHADVVAATADPFPGGSTRTFEPGGQIELSSPPRSLAGVWDALSLDRAALQARLAPLGAGIVAVGMHPDREPERLLDDSRYRAMEAYWSATGEDDAGAGLRMMTTTAAIQVSVDADLADAPPTVADVSSRDGRWRLAHALSPVLAACFANSPLAGGRVTGWRSTRLGVWEGLDRTRTAPALRTGRAVEDWTAYLLDANVMMIRADGHCAPLAAPFPFGRWLVEGHDLGWPDLVDLEYHISTLFPPVRAKGFLELRCMDAVDDPLWPVPLAITTALLDDPEAADGALRATGRASWCWCEAPRWSLDYEPLAEAARTCFDLARPALARLGAPAPMITAVERYQERFVDRSRCPADETLDGLRVQA